MALLGEGQLPSDVGAGSTSFAFPQMISTLHPRWAILYQQWQAWQNCKNGQVVKTRDKNKGNLVA